MTPSPAIRAVARGDAAAIVERARELGVMGWVRRGAGETVQVHAEGERVDELVAFLGAADTQRVRFEGHEQFAIRGVSAGEFVVFRAPRGFELQLEVGGAMRAWSVPKEPALDPSVKRLAVELERPSELDEVWDRGGYEQGGRVAWPEALDRGHAVFVLHGDRLRGGFALQRTRPPQWLLVKRRDAEAVSSSAGSARRTRG
jgi:acylphosphatase